MKDVTIYLVFSAGIATFVSPCFLPLLPVYIGFLSGKALGSESRLTAVRNSIGFVLGFTLVFVMLGATASIIGEFLLDYKVLIAKILGVIVIFMGLFYMDLISIRAFFKEKRISFHGKTDRFWGAVVFGSAIAFGWTPCIGPILATVLSIAASKNSYIYGMFLLFVYSMGIAVPFLITATLIQGTVATAKLRKLLKYSKVIKILTGIIMIVTGVIIYTDYFTRLAALLN